MVRGAGSQFSVATGTPVLAVASNVRYWIMPLGQGLSWEVHTGIGFAFAGEAAYQDLFESSATGGSVGTTVHFQVGRVAGLRLRVEDRVYRVRFGNRSAGGSSSPLHVSLGLDLPFHPRGP
jgi:hypothetical protein